MFEQDDLLPISALQHVVFCERQFALMYVERVWQESALTVEGRQLHERADGGHAEARGEVRIARGVPLRSLRLGLVGKADVVELWRDDAGCAVPGLSGRWRPYPIEYKRGRPKSHRADEVQLCAQGLCLEEMLDVAVPSGALFYAKTRRRVEVELDGELRQLVGRAAARARELLESRETPTAPREPKCDACSLLELCRPGTSSRSAARFLESALNRALADDPDGGRR